MSEWLAVMFAAMVAQLLVLPGEKVQFIIAGLSTRYRPVVVVSAAGLAFASWTALEIWFGEALKGALPAVYLDVISGGLFLLFGVLLLRSMPSTDRNVAASPQTDGGMFGSTSELDVTLFGREVPDRFGSFLPIFVMMATGEFGDKTQLVTINLAIQYGAHPGIWLGEMLVIIPVSIANAYFFSTFAHRFDARKAHVVGAAVFFFFGLDTFLAVLTGFSVWELIVNSLSAALFWVVDTAGVTELLALLPV